MGTKGVIINNGAIGANTIGSADSISGMIFSAVAAASLALGVVKTIYKPKDAEELGITANYDSTNNVRVYRHIKEFYRIAGEGRKLYIMLVAQATTMVQMVEDTNSVYTKKLIIEAKGEIKQLGVIINPIVGYVSTLLDGMDADVRNAIPKAQLLADWARDTFRPCSILLEGREFNGTAAAAINLRAIPNTPADHVSVIIGQDWDYAETQNAVGKKFADVGTALGCLSYLKVERNIGEVEVMNLADAGRNAWLTPGLSSHQMAKDVESSWDTLDSKGYIFGIYYTDYAGVYWNGDHTCVEIIVDAEGNINMHTIAYCRVVDKARRALRSRLLPKIRTTHKLDPATGQLPSGVIKYFEGIGDKVFEEMDEEGNITQGKCYVDPTSNLSVVPRILKVSFGVVPKGTIDEIQGTINLKASL